MSSLQVELVAADRRVWSGEARTVRARSVDGELGILHGEGGDQTTTIDSGFISVEHDRVTIIAESVGGVGQS